MELFIQSETIKLQFKEDFLFVLDGKKETPVNLKRIERIWLNPETEVSGKLLQALLSAGIDLVVCSEEGTPLGFLTPAAQSRGARARKKQLLFSSSMDGWLMAAGWILQKQEGGLAVLEAFEIDSRSADYQTLKAIAESNRLQFEQGRLQGTEDLQEAYFARLYWGEVSTLLPTAFRFAKRSRRPAQDPFNAVLNYTYGILYALVQGALQRVGLDPYIGCWHKEKDGQAALTFDLIEVFRPWATRIVLQLFREKDFSLSHFDTLKEGGCWINDSGKEILIHRFFDFLEGKSADGRMSPKDQIFQTARQLQQIIHHQEFI
ncbi:MAG: CRISPR-associated endonuclease Cas1 [Phaeodactylibacter sp.]|nr:CRISPR-associated endonuclease Cas1 [Phaeodactylibacter sp.]